MNKRTTSIVMIAGAVMAAVGIWSLTASPALTGEPRKIAGITADDPHPNGCVDCHVNDTAAQKDGRITTIIKNLATAVDPKTLIKVQVAMPAGATLKGKHPAVPPAMLKNIPGGCAMCHSKTAKNAPALAPMVHSIHLSGGAENEFLTVSQGECTSCHKLDAKTGKMSVGSGTEK